MTKLFRWILPVSVIITPVYALAQDAAPAAPVTAETAPVVAAPAPEAAPAKPADEYPKTKISGKVYGDLTHRTNLDNAGKDDKTKRAGGNGTGFDVKRFYIGVSNAFDKIWSATFVADIGDQNGKYDIFAKKAYIEAKPSDAAVFRLGSADLPWVPFVEDLYGYRYVENILIDRTKFGTSADWGAHFLGKVSILNYAFSAVNGGGYANPGRPKSMDPDVEGRIGVEPIKGLNVAVGMYNGHLNAAVPTNHHAGRGNAVVAYKSDRFRVGAEYFQAQNWSSVAKKTEDKSSGFSAWASALIVEPVSLFARFDSLKVTPNTKVSNADITDRYVLGGVEYKFNKSMNVALAYKNEQVANGDNTKAKYGPLNTSNGKIGSSKVKESGDSNEYGLWAQYAF